MLKENKYVLNEPIKGLKEILKEYEEYLYTKNKETTVFDKKNVIEKYIRNSNIMQSQIDVKSIDEWKKIIININNISNKRKNVIISQMRDIIKYIYIRDYIQEKIYKKIYIILENINNNTNNKIIDKEEYNTLKIWTLEEYQQFNNTIDKENWKMFFRLLFYTGLRIGEIRAIKWIDYNIQKQELYINKQVSNKTGYGNSYDVIPPKSKLSIRYIKLDNITHNMLLEYKYNILKEHNVNNNINNKYIFGYDKPYSASNIERVKNLYCIKANLPKIKIHDFRHSHCSMLIKAYLDNNLPINFLAVANRLGHTVKNTLDVYSHLYPKDNDNLVELLK
jgi:integrase